jgi:urease accessory protein
MGALLGLAGVQLPVVEPMLAASVLLAGLLVTARCAVPLIGAALLASVFAFFHGVAHGAELAGAGGFAPVAGTVLASALLQAAGIAIARWMRSAWTAALAGSSVALFGATLLQQSI